ncbi:hypothetical protein [Francisella tularensis]|nr:hypothetical protein [Francisella tularensis]
MYTTNAIESLNRQFRKVIKIKNYFLKMTLFSGLCTWL